MRKKNKVDVHVYDSSLTVSINGLLHVNIKRKKLLGVQSWLKDIDGVRWYYIEYTMPSREILCEYDDVSIWESILLKLEFSKIFE